MHSETDEEIRAEARFKLRNARLSYTALGPRPPSNYRAERGTFGEYQDMKRATDEFKQALRRQLSAPDYNRFYMRVERHCRMHRPFKDRPYRDWLGILQAVWSRALAGELQPMPYEYNDSGVQHRDAQKIQAVTQETTMKTKTKAVKPPKAAKPTHDIIGVRFMRGHNLQKVYSYTVPKKVKLHLGEEVIVPSDFDGYETNSVAVVVALNHTPEFFGELKQVYGRITPVKA